MHKICETEDKRAVFLTENSSHAITHLADTPELEKLIQEVMQSTSGLRAETEVIEVDLGRIVGESDLIETEEDDDIVYAKRKNRQTYSRFCKNRTSVPSSVITIHLRQLDKSAYTLVTAFIGKNAPPFPGDTHESAQSRDFWGRHALAWGRQAIEPGTETTVCPW